MLLFLDDMGGLEHVEDILSTWTYLSMKIRVPFPPRVLVLCKETDSIFKPEALEARIHVKLRKKLRKHSQGNTHSQKSYLQPDNFIQMAFRSIRFVQLGSPISEHLEEGVNARKNAGLDFKKQHLIHLLQDAIYHFAIN